MQAAQQQFGERAMHQHMPPSTTCTQRVVALAAAKPSVRTRRSRVRPRNGSIGSSTAYGDLPHPGVATPRVHHVHAHGGGPVRTLRPASINAAASRCAHHTS